MPALLRRNDRSLGDIDYVGEILDVAVDMRRTSPTFAGWEAVRLSGENKRVMWIPPGFAHGFLVVSDSAEFLYKTTDYYAPQDEGAVRWDDPDLAIAWPDLGIPYVLSAKDRAAPTLDGALPNR